MKVNLLFIDKSNIFAGAEQSLVSLLKFLDKSKYNFYICVNYLQEHHKYYSDNGFIVIHRSRSLKWWMGSDFSLKAPLGTDFIKRIIFAIRLASIIREYRIDICHFNLLRNSDYHDILFSRILGCKIVGHIRSLQTQVFLYKTVLTSGDRIICTSEKVLSEIPLLDNRVSPVRIYDPIDIQKYDTTGLDIVALREKYSVGKSSFILSSVAIIDKRKGHDISVLVLKDILKVYGNVRLIIAGGVLDSKEEKRLKALIVEQDLSGKVIFTGHIDQIREIYAISDIILSLSQDGEAFGRVPLEAAAARKIVITTRIGAALETVLDRVTGFLVDPENVSQVSEVIGNLIRSPDTMKSVSEAAHEHVLQKFSSDCHARQVESVYNSLQT